MGHLPLLDELAIVAVLGVAVTLLLSKFKLPAVAGLLAAGALFGPYGFGLVRSVHAIEVLAEIGVILLLFSIGLEFSLVRLRAIFRQVAFGGLLQVGLTMTATIVICMGIGQSGSRALFYGCVVALSSTAIVLRALEERREFDAPHGRFIVGTLIFQDLCVVPMMLVVPMLGEANETGAAATEIAGALLRASLVVVGTVVLSRFLVPTVLGWVDASRSREVFLLAILGLCIGTAMLTSLAGLSLALGAFLGGMVVADTEYGHRAMGDILPLRDAFVSIFFVSLGMLFDIDTVSAEPILVLGLLAAFVLGKGALATVAALAMRFPARVAWLAGVGLAQFGEFGFVLTRVAQTHGVVTEADVRPLLAAGILSMFLTPLLVRMAPHVTAGERLLTPLARLIGARGIDEDDARNTGLRDHVVLVGFGVAGRLTAQALRHCDAKFVVLDLNAESVREGRKQGLPVYYGDATSEEALRHAHIQTARLAVLLTSDPPGIVRIVDTISRVAPRVQIVVRTRYLSEREGLIAAGAHVVIVEEVEGALEAIARLLRRLDWPEDRIADRVARAREQTRDPHAHHDTDTAGADGA